MAEKVEGLMLGPPAVGFNVDGGRGCRENGPSSPLPCQDSLPLWASASSALSPFQGPCWDKNELM